MAMHRAAGIRGAKPPTQYFKKINASPSTLSLWSILGILSWLEFRPKNTFIWCVFVCTWLFDNSFILENSFEAKKVKSEMTLIFHFISHISIWKQCYLWTIKSGKIKSVHRWHCFHMKMCDIKEKYNFWKNGLFRFFLFKPHIFIWKQCHLWKLLSFFTLNSRKSKPHVFIGGTVFIWKNELKWWKFFFQKSLNRFSLKFYYGQI